MVTFSIPGDSELAEAGKSTPRPRPPLPFAKRAYVSSPYTNKRLGTPQSAPSRRLLAARDELSSSGLNKSTIAMTRNIFRASTITDSPSVVPFSPSLPQNTMKKVFAPGATPEPNRVYRESTAQASPRGMAAKATDKELFHMRIEDPDPELSGEVLTKKIPKEWNSKGSIYADQFLSHLCPPEFDDEQRRQFFAILDLRRLKYAANEIFSKKDWKLNVVNFAKEFEKSRSIILLRYGLYEFQNVKPSKDVLKRWRREHGLPEPEEEGGEPTPTKANASKKRKADDEPSKDTGISNNKRRAGERDEADANKELPAGLPAPIKNKRKASVSDEADSQPSKMQKSTPSAAKSLFEKIANKSSTPAGSPVKASIKPAEESVAAKPNPFATTKINGSGGLARSVFQNLKPGNAQAGGNIFGYLSDASSAKNSGVDADAESEADTEAEDSQETGQSEEPSAIASGTETASQIGSGLFGNKLAPTSAPAVGSSAPGTRESTPGRSLFERVTKNSEGQPVRLDDKPEADSEKAAAKTANQTWNPSTTPIKFAPAASTTQSTSLFGNNTSTPSGSIFAAKPSAASNIFGAKQDKPAEKTSADAEQKNKSGGESDKENDEVPKKSLFGSTAPAAQTSATSSIFGAKPSAETPRAAEPAKPLFGISKPDVKPAAAVSNIFGAASKPAEASTSAAPVLQSSTLFGTKTAEAGKSAEVSKAAPLFGTGNSTPASTTPAPTTTNLFGAKPSAATSTNLFGGASSTPVAKPLFGAASSGDGSAPKTDAAPAIFNFGGASAGASKPNGTAETAAKPLFAPKSPTSSAPLFGGSPMKQDNPSPAKKAFTGGSTGAASAAPIFSFGTSDTTSAPNFGGASSTPTNNTPSFGAGSSSDAGSGGFTFGASSGPSFNNPFASGNSGENTSFGSNSSSGGMFSFGANSAPSGGPAAFQFGGSSTPAPTFGANQGNNTTNSAPAFGGASGSGAPTFSFGGTTSQTPTSAPVFGSTPAPAFNLQPPAGGASTTGTNTPFSLGGGSSLATTPAGGTPEPSSTAQGTTNNNDEEEGEKHEQINLTEGVEKDEEVLHDVRAKILKFASASEKSDDKKAKSKSPWVTQGIGPLRILKHKETNAVRLLMRSEPRGNVAINRSILPEVTYKADDKYVKLTTSNETGDGLETWMVQVKTKDLAKDLAEALEKHKELNKK